MGLPEILAGNKKYISIICFTITFLDLCFAITSQFACERIPPFWASNWHSPSRHWHPQKTSGIYKAGPYDRSK